MEERIAKMARRYGADEVADNVKPKPRKAG
jgi:hypothetical protein